MITRRAAIEAIAGRHFEVVVIGGGITGAGVALDAASRGYSVALLEARDYAWGTSSRSSKMVHGGLRYLQNLDLGLVREALLERSLLVNLAPHLVYPTPFLVPTLAEGKTDRKIGLGLNMYDVMASSRSSGRGGRRDRLGSDHGEQFAWSPDRHRVIDGADVTAMIPALGAREPRSAYLFYDCQTDDSRLVMTVLAEAERYGAVSLNGAEVLGLIDENGRAAGVIAREAESGEELRIGADHVINATGVWADRIRPGEITAEEDIPRISPSRGTHLTVAAEDLPVTEAACIVPAGEGRTIFALPWYGRTLIGTTDNDFEGDIDRVGVADGDIEYLLTAINAYFGTELGRSNLTGAFAGLRPLISAGDPKKSVDISRRAELYETSSGMITITGGKLTTWRRMAKMTLDRVVEREGREARCLTAEIPLGMPADRDRLNVPEGITAATVDQLAFRYGHRAARVLDRADRRPELARPIVDGMPDLLAEVTLAAEEEQARGVADVLLRRTRLGLVAAPNLRSRETIRPVAAELGRALGWGKERIETEIDAWFETMRVEGLDPAQSLTYAP